MRRKIEDNFEKKYLEEGKIGYRFQKMKDKTMTENKIEKELKKMKQNYRNL